MSFSSRAAAALLAATTLAGAHPALAQGFAADSEADAATTAAPDEARTLPRAPTRRTNR